MAQYGYSCSGLHVTLAAAQALSMSAALRNFSLVANPSICSSFIVFKNWIHFLYDTFLYFKIRK
jgi:hypothetical protein